MTHTLSYNSGLQILEVNIQGDYFADEARELVLETAELAEEHHCFRILVDMRAAEIHLATLEIYEAPQMISDAFAGKDNPGGKVKRAVVVKTDSEDPKFLETVAVNRGQRVRIFQNMDEAKEWLLQ